MKNKTALFFTIAIILVIVVGKIHNSYIEKKTDSLVVKNDGINSIANNEKDPNVLYNDIIEFLKSDLVDLANNTFRELETDHPDFERLSEAEVLITDAKRKNEIAAEEQEKRKIKTLSKLKKNYDDISGITWYTQHYFTHYVNRNLVSVSMGQRSGGAPWLNLTMSYAGSDWIFFEKAYLSFEGNTMEIPFNHYKDKKTDVVDGGICEWIEVHSTDISFLELLSESKAAKVRYSGKYTKTRNLTANERKGINDVIEGYYALKGY